MQIACSGLFPVLESGATVVTPNRFLAHLAGHNFARRYLVEGRESWQRPNILSASAWLSTCWQTARYSNTAVPSLLSAAQEQALWQRIIQQQTPGLFDVESTAVLASRAASLICEWRVPLEHEAWNEHEDGRHFRQWLAGVRETCQEQAWITRFDLWQLVPTWIAAGWCETNPVAFIGFSIKTPALLRLYELLGRTSQLLNFDAAVPTAHIAAHGCDDLPAEIEMAARWARAGFELDSGDSIGVFVPQLAANRLLVERVFDEIFHPAGAIARLKRTAAVDQESAFHVHAAAPLREQPLIAGALLLLQLASPRIPIGEAGAIFRSPWVTGAESERNNRAIADLDLRRSRELDVSLRDLEYHAKTCPQLQNTLRRIRQVISGKPARAEFADWSEFFSELLSAAGWPGDDDLTSAEQDLVDVWKDALSSMASLTLVAPPVAFEKALQRLTSALGETGPAIGDLFSPIQIVDASQAIGLRFDRAFAVGLSEENSFFKAANSALIPLKLQRACGLPDASAGAIHKHRSQIIHDLFSVAPHIRVTFSNRILPGVEKFVVPGENDFSVWQGRTASQSLVTVELDRLEDTNAPRYQPCHGSLGGTGVIKDQSQCPFRAFAARRLFARSPEDGSFGIDALDRGRFVHDALKYVWDVLKTQHALKSYPPFELKFLVEEAVTQAMPNREKGPLNEQLSLAEIDRLIDVVNEWLEIERARKIPFQVELTEHQRGLDISGLHLDIRIDRIDCVPGGKKLLIDYKSGDTSASSLVGDRPKEPQLLTYATAMRDEVAGFFFAQLKPRTARFVGYARDEHFKGQKSLGKNVTWDDFLADRVQAVERLASSFAAGAAAVHPLKQACEFCNIGPLCRINEVRRDENGDDVAG